MGFSLSIVLLFTQEPDMEFGRSNTTQDQVQFPGRGTRDLVLAVDADANVQSQQQRQLRHRTQTGSPVHGSPK